MHKKAPEHEHGGYGVYVITWISLLVLTAITVTAAGMKLGTISVLMAIAIATVKAGVVLSFFMHLKYESALLKTTVGVGLAALAVFIGLTFVDVLFR